MDDTMAGTEAPAPIVGPSSTNDPRNAKSGPMALIIAGAVVLCLMAAATNCAAGLSGLIYRYLSSYESYSSSSSGLGNGYSDGHSDGYGYGYNDEYGLGDGSGSNRYGSNGLGSNSGSDEYWYPIH